VLFDVRKQCVVARTQGADKCSVGTKPQVTYKKLACSCGFICR
jgi:hypothetical protein